MVNKNQRLEDKYAIELDTSYPFFDDSEESYYYYVILDTTTGQKAGEGICSLDVVENEAMFGDLSFTEQVELLKTYLQEHIPDLLQKKNVNELYPLVRDLVMASVNSESGMYFVESYEEMSEDEREIYTEENLERIAEEVEKEGLEHYIEVGPLESYAMKEDQLVPSGNPVITVYMGVGTLFDLSEGENLQKEANMDVKEKVSLDQQIIESVPEEKIGRIDYLHTDGRVRESIEYESLYQFKKDILEENYYGVPMKVSLYADKNDVVVPHDFLYELDPPIHGISIIRSPYLEKSSFESQPEISMFEPER